MGSLIASVAVLGRTWRSPAHPRRYAVERDSPIATRRRPLPCASATLRWNVDNKATIWINGHQLVTNAGTWTSIISTPPVPAAWLQSGVNTIAVKVTQDNNTNTWSVNPTMFQAELTIPTQSP